MFDAVKGLIVKRGELTNPATSEPELRQSDGENSGDGFLSLFALGSMLLRNRWQVFRWIVIGGALAILPVLFQKTSYTSTASFVSEGGQNAANSGIAGIAGRFGIQLGNATPGQSPQFYAQLLSSSAILAPVLADTFAIAESGRKPQTLLDVLDIKGDTPASRTAKGVTALNRLVGVNISDKTGIMTISTTTDWPSLSQDILQRVLTRLNDFNLHTRQHQASEERRFTEDRLKQASASLNAAEDRLLAFVQRNRSFESSAELSVEHTRLQRQVQLQLTVVNALEQSFEEARMREVRDTPVITIIEDPSMPTEANSRGWTKRGLLGMFLGALFGVLIIFLGDGIRHRRAEGDPDTLAFFEAFGDATAGIRRFVLGRSPGTGSS